MYGRYGGLILFFIALHGAQLFYLCIEMKFNVNGPPMLHKMQLQNKIHQNIYIEGKVIEY